MAETIVKLDNVTKVYHRDAEEVRVLEGLSFRVDKGDFVALMGPSGSGKTTLLNLMGGIDKATSGRVVVGEADLGGMSEKELARWRSHHVGFIFQLYHLIPVLTAFENVELPLLLHGMSKVDRARRVETALRVVGLADRMDHYPRQLSGGQEQRVAIARAIVADPLLLLADEPTGDLDAKSAEEILTLLDLLNKELGKTIVMVTHDPKAAAHARRSVHLEKGVLERETAGEAKQSAHRA
ncbi:MAG TPA: ABC transporter ATP-binding protein [Polyangia bacterium]|nr:ABC transporter ATP-binding protein [Polyangia bacterium]